MVAEIKKKCYVYYHCSRAKGKCPEPYIREEVLEERFAELLDRLRFGDEVLAWVSQALHVSHADEKQHHKDAIRRIQAEYDRLQNRSDAMYVDKLDGRTDTDFFDHKAAGWRELGRQPNLPRREHPPARTRAESRRAVSQAIPDRKTPTAWLRIVLSSCIWKAGQLAAAYCQPFDLLAKNMIALESKKPAERA